MRVPIHVPKLLAVLVASASLGFVLGPGLAGPLPLGAETGLKPVYLLPAQGVIDPVLARFLARGIAQAEAEAGCVIIQLDTPGGLDKAMREIIKAITGSRVPVVVYVAPAGARAASAGVFITMAAHVAAMAPATDIGAAHPVALEGEFSEEMEAKVVNEAAAYIRALAEAHGRNADWAEKAVRESLSLPATAALEEGVIDLIAADLEELLQELDGRTVMLPTGPVELRTAGAPVRWIALSLPERLVHKIVDPNIAYVLFTLGIWGIIAEFYHPGAILPGLTGVILLILAFIAFGSLPVNWGGVALLLLAILLFILDLKVSGFILSVFGGIAFVLGSLLLFRPFGVPMPALPRFSVNPWLIAVMTAGFASFFSLVVTKVLRAHRERVTSGTAGLIGAMGQALTPLDPQGVVRLRGEEWTAEAVEGPIPAGSEVEVMAIEGLKLKVRRKGERP